MESSTRKNMKNMLWLFAFPYYIYRYVFIAIAMRLTGENEKNKKTKTIGHILAVLFLIILVPVFILSDYFFGHWRQLEGQFSYASPVEYQSGKHQITLTEGTTIESYTVKLLITIRGLHFFPIKKSSSQYIFSELPIYIPWEKIESCMRGGDYGDGVRSVHLSIKGAGVIIALKHWDLISPICLQKKIPISNY